MGFTIGVIIGGIIGWFTNRTMDRATKAIDEKTKEIEAERQKIDKEIDRHIRRFR